MEKPKIIAYLKPSCGWSQGVRAVLRKYDLPFEDRDITEDPAQRQEMIEKTGQMLSPCVEVNGKMLPDVSGDEVEAYLLASALVSPNAASPMPPPTRPAPTRCRPPRRRFGSRLDWPAADCHPPLRTPVAQI
jgi:glutaredoxin